MRDEFFEEIPGTCKGQLRVEVYRAIHETALAAPSGDMLEIGTAHGAATVVLARALKISGRKNTVYTIGKPGVGSHIGIPKEISERFELYGVDDFAMAIVAEASEAKSRLPPDLSLGLLMLDADGRIDRDLENFFDNVIAGAPIIIDDYEDRVPVKLGRRGRALSIDLKHRLTFALANYLRYHGYLEDFRVVHHTLFCRKVAGAEAIKLDRNAILDLYASILYSWEPLDRRTLRRLVISVRDIIRPRR